MQKPLTWWLTGAALILFGLIVFFERRLPNSAERRLPPKLYPRLRPDKIHRLAIRLPDGAVVRAEWTNGQWALTSPNYPAQQAAIENFVTNLVQLRVLDRIPRHEVALQGQKAFGFDPPRAEVEIDAETNAIRFEIGGLAPLTNNVYLRAEGSSEVVLTDAGILRSVPRSPGDWRHPALVYLGGAPFDHVEIRSGQRVFELAKNETNGAWQITKPIPARADQERVAALFDQLRAAQVDQFVTDAPLDIERFGLNAPEVELGFSRGTNRLYSVEFGGVVTNQLNAIYARLIGQSNIVVTSRALVDFLKQPYKNFHEPRLVTFRPEALDRIIVRAAEQFTLQRQPDGQWIGSNARATRIDPELFKRFLSSVSALRIVDIAREVPTEADLSAMGLIAPIASYSFFEKLTNAAGALTNILFTDILFGASQADRVFVRRSDEAPVYVTEAARMLELPRHLFQLGDRRVWSFRPEDVTRLAVMSQSGTNSAARSAAGWSDDAVANAALGEIVIRLSELRAVEWIAQGAQPEGRYGLRAASPRLLVELKGANGPERRELHFGGQSLQRDVYAQTRRPETGQDVVFTFPALLYQLIFEQLPLPK